MSPSKLNPVAAEFTPPASRPSTVQSEGQRRLNPEAIDFIPDAPLEAALFSGNNTGIEASSKHLRHRGTRYRQRRPKQPSNNRSPAELGDFQTHSITPFNQWQASLTRHRHHDAARFQHNANFGPNHQEYKTVDFYKKGKYGKMTQKTKQRDLALVYGYRGSDKQVQGMFHHRDASIIPGREKSSAYGNNLGRVSGRASGCPPGNGFPSGPSVFVQQPGDIAAPYPGYIDQHESHDNSVPGFPVYPAGGPSAATTYPNFGDNGAYSQMLGNNGEVIMQSAPLIMPGPVPCRAPQPMFGHIGSTTVEDQISQVDALRNAFKCFPEAKDAIASLSPVRRSSTQPHTSNNRGAHLAPNPEIEQQEGGIVADHDFATRVLQAQKTGTYLSMTTVVAEMHRQAKDRFFPADMNSFNWPQKTPHQLGYVDRAHVLSEMGEAQLAELFKALTGGGQK